MTVKEFNTVHYPKIRHAISFVHSLDHALFKAGEEAERQVKIIGWNEELKQTLFEAIDHYEKLLRSEIEKN